MPRGILLEQHEIGAVVRNAQLASAVGEIPPIEAWAELWVVREEHFDRAKELVTAVVSENGPTLPQWVCTGCGETVEGQFSDCWACGQARPE